MTDLSQMPDGNSAALRKYESDQARSDRLWDENSERVLQDIVDELWEGKKVCGYTWEGLAEDVLTMEDWRMVGRAKDKDDFAAAWDSRMRKVEDSIKQFFIDHVSHEIWERMGERDGSI